MSVENSQFVQALLALLEETFESVQGIYLDKNTSLFETLGVITAETASASVGGRCGTLAAQVKHTVFYLDVLERGARTGIMEPVDWDQIWRDTRGVSDAGWRAIQDDLRASYARIRALAADTKVWDANTIGGAMGVLAHTAYHLGEIRQALCVLQPAGPRLSTLKAFKVVGISRRVRGGSPEISKLWDEFVPRIGTIKHAATPMVSFGLMSNFDTADGTMDYVACQQVTETSGQPAGMSAHDVPGQTYLAFDTTLPEIGHAMGRLHGEWLPKLGYEQTAGPMLERYDADFSPEYPNLSIFVPVKRRE